MLRPDTNPEAIIWDLDGTLVESAPDLATALNTLLNEQGQHGHPVDCVRPMIGGGVAVLIERGFHAAGTSLTEEERDALVPRFMEIYRECCTDSTALMPYARESLSFFYHAGAVQAVCTNKPLDVTDQILNSLDIMGYFGSVVGGDSTPHKKPHPQPLLTCLDELGVTPSQAVMIGDSGADVGAAQGAGVPIILVSGGYTGMPATALGADYVVTNLSQLPGSLVPKGPLRRSA